MQLAVFDLDQTLLSGDSDYEWGQHLIDLGVVDAEPHSRENQRFFAQYQAGTLDIHEYARFAFEPFTRHSIEDLLRWRESFMDQRIRPLIRPKARALIEQHRAQAHTTLIITSTNRFVATPAAAAFAVDDLLATELAQQNGRYTGEIAGEPCLGAGKVKRLQEWLAERGVAEVASSWCYSDSHNDIPLLGWAQHPVAVDPDERLAAHAHAHGWPIISLA